ncbi:endonuclease/exonuclease/phosphatase family protein [Marisediminicola antarctica]|uniref:Hydrolase n=1 Tax=Marisediminicola antarctica TaxID=674079 RepID=A0A7L5AEL0_9MICO|nr:endonuclease/exonuclease/phosphatase family protein [Marisediminicola antarctica]QHO68497.1 hydrolase [Marisediminicola antarctica]
MTDAPLVGPADAPDLHVMSYNIRRRMPQVDPRSSDNWSHRKGLVKRLLLGEQPTLLGIQEALPDQLQFLTDTLGTDYRFVGHGRRADHGGEHSVIFYDSRRLELLDWSQSALSDTPELAGSVTWGNQIPRVIVRATFHDTATGAVFVAITTHFDHINAPSRERSAEAIRELVERSEMPAVVIGDFNADASGAAHRVLVAQGLLRDSWQVAHERLSEQWGTAPHYRAPILGGERIDWILVGDAFEVGQAVINVTRYEGSWPSDHTPVQALIRVIDERSEQ